MTESQSEGGPRIAVREYGTMTHGMPDRRQGDIPVPVQYVGVANWRETLANLKTVRAQLRLEKVFDLLNGGQWSEAKQLASQIEADLELPEGVPPNIRFELDCLLSRFVISFAQDRSLETQMEDLRLALENYIDEGSPSPTLVGKVELALRWAQVGEVGHRRL